MEGKMAYPVNTPKISKINSSSKSLPWKKKPVSLLTRQRKHQLVPRYQDIHPDSSSSKIKLEPIEPRFLLSADPFTVAMSELNNELTISLYTDALSNEYLQITDDADQLVDQRLLQEVSEVLVTGTEGADNLTIDFSNIFSIADGIHFDAGLGDDQLNIVNGDFSAIDHDLLGQGLGEVDLTNASSTEAISYQGLESLADQNNSNDRSVRNQTGAEQTIRFSDNNVAGDGVSTIDNNGGNGFTSLSIANTTGSLSIYAGDLGDTVIAQGMDSVASAQVNIHGGAGNDTLVAGDLANQWVIDGVNEGSLNDFLFSGIENLTGGSNDDTFNFSADGSISGTIDGGAGNNTLDYSAMNAGVAIDLNTRTHINELVGSTGNDSLQAADSDNSWILDGLDIGTVNGLRYTGVENLKGGEGADTFELNGGVSSGLIDGGLGLDNLTADDINNNWLIAGIDAGDVNNINFDGIENLTGGTAEDAFVFAAGGLISGAIAGRGGSDRVRGANKQNDWKITNSHTGNLNGMDFSEIETLEGGDNTDTLIGPDADTTWNITGADVGHVVDTFFTGMEKLEGAADNEDIFIIDAGGSVSGGLEGGAGGFDTVLVEEGGYTDSVYVATGPDAGRITLNGVTTTYAGFEPVGIVGGVNIVIDIDISEATTNVLLTKGVGVDDYILSSGDAQFEDHNITLTTTGAPATLTQSLTINFIGSEADQISVTNLAGTSMDDVLLAINTQGGIDQVTLDNAGAVAVNTGAGDDTLNLDDAWGDLDLDLGSGSADVIDFTSFSGQISFDVAGNGDVLISDASDALTQVTISAGELADIVNADFDIDLTGKATELVTALEGMIALIDDMATLGDLDAALPLIGKNAEVTIAQALDFVESIDTLRARLEAFITDTVDDAGKVTTDDLIGFFNGINGSADDVLSHLGA
ncbi:MAG: LEPR-XLL domain-containing protein, partial [Methyloprofundus sp.]|nr:LEPR-XLL domain-containing protein [Methyloprofundus sp.]